VTPSNSRVNIYDLGKNQVQTLPASARNNIRQMAISPDSSTLVLTDDQSNITVVDLSGNTVLHQIKSKFKVKDIKFSPDG